MKFLLAGLLVFTPAAHHVKPFDPCPPGYDFVVNQPPGPGGIPFAGCVKEGHEKEQKA